MRCMKCGRKMDGLECRCGFRMTESSALFIDAYQEQKLSEISSYIAGKIRQSKLEEEKQRAEKEARQRKAEEEKRAEEEAKRNEEEKQREEARQRVEDAARWAEKWRTEEKRKTERRNKAQGEDSVQQKDDKINHSTHKDTIPNVNSHEENRKDGNTNGYGKMTFSNGEYEGEIKDGKQNGH